MTNGVNQKWLLQLIVNTDKRVLFFVGLGLVTGFFIAMMLEYNRRVNRRNFKEDRFRKQILTKTSTSTSLVVRDPNKDLPKDLNGKKKNSA